MSHFPENRFLFTLQPPVEVEFSNRSTCFIWPHSLCEPCTEAIWLGTSTPYCSCSTRRILLFLLTLFFHCVKATVPGPGSKWVLSWEICISRSGPNVGFVNFTDVDLELKAYKVWEAVVTFFSASAAWFPVWLGGALYSLPLWTLLPGSMVLLCLSQRPRGNIQCMKSHVNRGANRWLGCEFSAGFTPFFFYIGLLHNLCLLMGIAGGGLCPVTSTEATANATQR